MATFDTEGVGLEAFLESRAGPGFRYSNLYFREDGSIPPSVYFLRKLAHSVEPVDFNGRVPTRFTALTFPG